MTSNLPDVSSPSIILAHPTESERLLIWAATHDLWGSALSLQSYLRREEYLLEGPGYQTQWMLTDGSYPPDQRPILSSCDTLKKPGIVVDKDGSVRQVTAHGIASVFTFPRMRGRGYARKLMTSVGEELKRQQENKDGDAVFSVLYSDVGKKFYNTVGWKPFESEHLELSTVYPQSTETEALQIITMDMLPSLTARDVELMSKELPKPSTKTRVALTPDEESINWHLYREDFMCDHIFSCKPTARGGLYTPAGKPNSRIWAYWTRNFYGGKEKPEKNILNLMRFVVEDGSISDEELEQGIRAIAGLAQDQAKEWLCSKIEWWNPSERVRRLGERVEGSKYVVREGDSIPSLKWFGEGSVDDVEWVANEKYGWC